MNRTGKLPFFPPFSFLPQPPAPFPQKQAHLFRNLTGVEAPFSPFFKRRFRRLFPPCPRYWVPIAAGYGTPSSLPCGAPFFWEIGTALFFPPRLFHGWILSSDGTVTFRMFRAAISLMPPFLAPLIRGITPLMPGQRRRVFSFSERR